MIYLWVFLEVLAVNALWMVAAGLLARRYLRSQLGGMLGLGGGLSFPPAATKTAPAEKVTVDHAAL